MAQILEVPLAGLKSGDNTIEYVTRDVPQSYPTAVLNIDHLVTTE